MRDTEKDDVPYLFAERVLTVSLPTALMLVILVLAEEVEPMTAIAGFAMVVCLTIVLALPFLMNLKNLTQYVHKLAQDEDVSNILVFSKKDEESIRIVAAINQMRNVWTSRTESLEAQTLSDAAVLDSLPDPLLMLDEKGSVIGANLAARHLFGFNVRRQTLSMLVESQYLPLAAERVLQEESRKESLEICIKEKVFNAKIERLPAEAKAGAVALLSLYDMTARKQFEQMQVDFIANASHELRTPLSVLSGFIETLQGTAKEDGEARERFLNIMQVQADRMSRLIESLLCLSRLQMNEKSELAERADIPEILKTVKQMLDAKAAKTDMNIVLKPCEQSGIILSNVSELHQVFQNLTDNALKYGKSGGKVTVSCRVLSGEEVADVDASQIYAVSVHNTGNPISKENIPHLFERFYRVSETKNKAVGTGLGLSIVKQIVKHHNGHIDVQSSNETGTVFTVYLPMLPRDSFEENDGLQTTEQSAPASLEQP